MLFFAVRVCIATLAEVERKHGRGAPVGQSRSTEGHGDP